MGKNKKKGLKDLGTKRLMEKVGSKEYGVSSSSSLVRLMNDDCTVCIHYKNMKVEWSEIS